MNYLTSRGHLIIRRIKFFFQKRSRGWSDDETWSLDTSLSVLILPRLKRFKELKNGYPGEMTIQEWDAILDKMIGSFEFYSSEVKYSANAKDFELHQEGLDLFAKYFGNLWW